MRPSHLLPVAGLTFALLLLAPLARGSGQPPAKAPQPKLAEPNRPPAVELPITRVVLFNAGVGYFHREGEVTGDARLDLRFIETDINDLLKSLVLTDRDGGKVRAVTYDNRMPVDLTLKTFAVDVTENPTVGQLLHQVRGEKVEVTDKGGVVTVGQIVSVERPPIPAMGPDPGELLNLLAEDGLQTVELKQLRKIKFVRPELQAEFRKALELLASSRGDNKKAVSVVFSGAGKRKVAVGYVTEAPLWKPSYRLSVDEKGAARIQGWATVENTTDEDWNNVKVGLVTGRPMTFQMDLYDPLFVPRPTVEPSQFASLRPPMYQGGLNPIGNLGGGVINPAPAGFAGGIGGIGGFGGGIGGFGGGGGYPIGRGGGAMARSEEGVPGVQGGIVGLGGYVPYPQRGPRPDLRNLYGSRLTYEEYVNRLHGKGNGDGSAQKTARDPLDKDAGALAAADAGPADTFEYTIDEPITLPRQKSAMLPLVNEPVEGSRVTIYNARVLDKHPLLGLKLVNKTKLHLAQGPVAVYEGGTFAGDARLPDMKPGETRLVSYAIDTGTEVVVERPEPKWSLVAIKVQGGRLETTTRQRSTTKYLVRNRNAQERAVVIEHPYAANRKLVAPEKPADRTRDDYRFEFAVKPGQLVTFEVTEDADTNVTNSLTLEGDYGVMLYYSKLDTTPPAVREALRKVVELRDRVTDLKRAIQDEEAAMKEIADDQERIRKNIERVPKESDAFKRYLKKFDEQETEIERRQARLKELKADVLKQEKALKDFGETAKAE